MAERFLCDPTVNGTVRLIGAGGYLGAASSVPSSASLRGNEADHEATE
jgi:hypothetical protein